MARIRSRRRGFRRGPRRGVSTIIGAVLLVLITIVLVGVLYAIRLPLPSTAPTIGYTAVSNIRIPVWGDPTDCRPNLPHNWTYYLDNGTGNPLYTTYMDDWESECEDGTSGIYNFMNATQIIITQISKPIPLKDVIFDFICTNTTPTYIQTSLVQGSLASMQWFPGETEANLTSASPKLGSCATFDASGYGGGANGVYYNRLGYFRPLNSTNGALEAGDTIIIYIHTPSSILEAPNPIESSSKWDLPDTDDYHGGPPWCFTVPGACTITLTDNDSSPATLIASIPLSSL